ncbi:MAG: hypothetical protein ACRDRI_11875 [Pseudonocardiaceae bacterium]
MTDVPLPRWSGPNRRVIPAAGAPRRGSVGFTILVARKRDGQVGLDPHAVGARKVTLNQEGARVLRGALTGWLR